MRILILTLLLIAVTAVAAVAPKPCLGDDCNHGRRCYTDSQCKCGTSCLPVRGDIYNHCRYGD